MTMFEETIYNLTYPLYATYMKLLGLLLTTILVVISSSYVIHVILKNKELRNTNNTLIINLLITDLAGFKYHHNCRTTIPIERWLIMSARMMILPPAVHRFICVARPFTHKLIMTKRRIIMMIVVLWAVPTIIYVALGSNTRAVYVPSLGDCATLNSIVELGRLLLLITDISSFLLIITSAVYLHHKIIHTKAYIRELHQFGTAQQISEVERAAKGTSKANHCSICHWRN